MTHRIALLLTAILICLSLPAQQRFTERIQQRTAGRGEIILHHSAAIADLVDGLRQPRSQQQVRQAEPQATQVVDTLTQRADTAFAQPTVQRVRKNGFRIQVYAGGNSREAKMRAEQMEHRVTLYYPQLNTYTRFISPRWICHVGDFLTREEALAVLQDLRTKGGFNEAIIVRSKVNSIVQ